MSTKERMLVPVDYTGCAYEVVGSAAELAGRLGTDVVLLNVVEVPDGVVASALIHPTGSPDALEAVDYLDEDARSHLQEYVAVFSETGVKAEIALRHGDCVDAILETADAIGAMMIVMGTHGRTGIKRLIGGSVAESVIRRAMCPVTVIRTLAPDAHPGRSDAQTRVDTEACG